VPQHKKTATVAPKVPRRIALRGVRVHNLKGVDLDIPLHRLVVFTGVSGSGKSSLAFDTLYAEGQRRYIETFSAYTRQFLETLDKPDAERIDGIPPAVAVAQRVVKRAGRSTVGTVTEVHDHLALLYGRIGQVICSRCGSTVRPADTAAVVSAIDALPEGTRYQIAFPVDTTPETNLAALGDSLRESGFLRVQVDGRVFSIDNDPPPRPTSGPIDVIVDRLLRGREDPGRRLDSIETAFDRGLGRCRIIHEETTLSFVRGWRCGTCGADYLRPDPRLFNPNSPLGACPACEGFGRIIDLDFDRIIPDKTRSLKDGAIVPWTMPAYRRHLDALLHDARQAGLPVDVAFERLSTDQRGFIKRAVRSVFTKLERKLYKLHVRVFLSRWRSYHPCPSCRGARLRPEALAVRIDGKNIAELATATLADALEFLTGIEPTGGPAASRVLEGVRSRLTYLVAIGLDYLTLDRPARTLSAGESRRVTLTTAMGSGLVNTLYVLDEPSIGLHPRDVGRLIDAMQGLRDAGNSLVVVEHEANIIRAADQVVDIGPGAGDEGGRLVVQGTPDEVAGSEASITGAYLSGRKRTPKPATRRAPAAWLALKGASGRNLRDLDVDFPLGVLCVVTGVSGSGKSTLVEETLFPALLRLLGGEPIPGEPYRELTASATLGEVVLLDGTPIGRSSRSTPATYVKAFDEIRRAFAALHESKQRNYGPGTFSLNVEGGRCSSCEGHGFQTIDMQFLADVVIRCPVCRGTRFRPEVLEVKYRGKSIADVLDMTAREGFSFFRHHPKAQARLRPLLDVGLDYLRLGQPVSTLSGGEAQRLKLSSRLATSMASIQRAATGPKTVFLMDEPTTGLHPADVSVLLDALNRLVDLGHSLILVEHSPEVMSAADWIIDLGPDAGPNGGGIVAAGTPERVAESGTATGKVLAGILNNESS
jgi:excinuclease ABC subunit A